MVTTLKTQTLKAIALLVKCKWPRLIQKRSGKCDSPNVVKAIRKVIQSSALYRDSETSWIYKWILSDFYIKVQDS